MDISFVSAAAALLAFLAGLVTGGVEVISRYRDEPFQAVKEKFGLIYVLVNALLGVVAYGVLLETAAEVTTLGAHLGYALLGGFGAAAILRVRVTSVKVGDEDVAIGPGIIVDQLLSALDRQIDRSRALRRTEIVFGLPSGLSFQATRDYASNMILESTQNLSLQEQKDLASKLKDINEGSNRDQDKVYALGFLVLNFMGEEFFETIFKADRLKDLQAGPSEPDGELDTTSLVRSRLVSLSFQEARQRFEGDLQKLAAETIPPLTAEECEDLRENVREIAAEEVPDPEKSQDLGFMVVEIFGSETFKRLYPPPQEAAEPAAGE